LFAALRPVFSPGRTVSPPELEFREHVTDSWPTLYSNVTDLFWGAVTWPMMRMVLIRMAWMWVRVVVPQDLPDPVPVPHERVVRVPCGPDFSAATAQSHIL
jgi:hypothetical protein